MHQHLRLAFGLQAVQHALHARRLAAQHRLGQLEDVVARDVQHRALDLLETQLAGRVQQRQLLDLLVRRQQVALDAVGEELQRALAFLASRHALVVLRQAFFVVLLGKGQYKLRQVLIAFRNAYIAVCHIHAIFQAGCGSDGDGSTFTPGR